MKKRLLSLLLCLVMVFSLLPVNTLAAEVEPVAEAEEEQETVLTDLIQEEEEPPAGEEPAPPAEPEEEESDMEPEETTEEAATEEGSTVSAASEEEPEGPEEDVRAEGEDLSDETTGGVTENGLIWELNEQGTVTITGHTDAMPSYLEMPISIEGHPVTAIGEGAFSGSGLTGVRLASSLTSIGRAAFQNCSAMSGMMNIPLTVTSVGDLAFQNCSSLTELSIRIYVETIGNNAFENCSGLTKLTIDKGVTTIGSGAFRGCSRLTSVTIPESVIYIGSHVFMDCTGLKSATIPESLTSIPAYAFFGCSNLTRLTIPESVTAIDGGAFQGCSGLERLTIPERVASIGENAFNSCSSLKTIFFTQASDAPLTIGEGAFYLNDLTETSVRIPDPAQINPAISGYDWAGSNRVATFETVPSSGTTENGLAWRVNEEGNVTITDYDEELLPADLVVPTEIDGRPVTKIGDYAFYYHGNTGVGDVANISTLTLPEGLLRIGEGAFRRSPVRGETVLPNSLREVADLAFAECHNTIVTIPPLLYTIAPSAFRGTAVTMTSWNMEYTCDKDHALFSKDKTILYSVPASISGVYWIPDGVTTIADTEAFYNCGLSGVVLPRTLRSVPAQTFGACPNLTYICFGHTAEDELVIEEGAFEIDEGVLDGPLSTTVQIPDPQNINPAISGYDWAGSNRTVTYETVQTSGTTETGLIWRLNEAGTVTITGGDATLLPEDLTIPAEIIGRPVTDIADSAFYSHQGLKSVVLPDSVTSLGSSIFRNCSALESVALPDSITVIGERDFYMCSSLKSIRLPTNLIQIKTSAFYNSGLENIDLPETLQTVGDSAFRHTHLEHLELPASLVYLDKYAFANIGSLRSLAVKEGVTTIGAYAFYSCGGLRSVDLPDSVTKVGDYAFYYAAIEDEFHFPASLQSIGDHAFARIKVNNLVLPEGLKKLGSEAFLEGGMTSVYLPDSLESLPALLFSRCSYLEEVRLPSGIETIPDGFFHMAGLTHFEIPGSVRAIGERAFEACKKLESVTIPDTVEEIRSSAFSQCYALKAVRLPSNLTVLGSGAFSSCVELRSVNVPEEISALEKSVFSNCSSLESISLPDTVISIGESAFKFCSSLSTISIPRSVNNIGKNAFADCKSLQAIRFGQTPEDELSIGVNAFSLTYQVLATFILVDDPSNIHPAISGYDWEGGGRYRLVVYRLPLPEDVELPLLRLSPTSDIFTEVRMLNADGLPTGDVLEAERIAVYVDRDLLEDDAYDFMIIPEAYRSDGQPAVINNKTLKYSSTDTKIATVKAYEDGSAVVTVKKKANGACTISGTATVDGRKLENSISVYIRDYTPRLQSTSITVNSWKTGGVSVPMVAGYDNEILSAALASDKFEASYADGFLTIRAKGEQKNGTTKNIPLYVRTAAGAEAYRIDLNITVKNAAPAVTVKQTQKYNTFLKESSAIFSLSAADGITGAEFETATYRSSYADGVLTVTKQMDAPKKAVAKGTLTVTVDGYTYSFTKTITVGTESKKADLALSAKAFTINKAYGEQTVRFSFVGEIPTAEPDVTVKPAGAANVSYSGGEFTVTDIVKTATLTIKVQEEAWTAPMSFTAKITVNSKAPTVKMAPATLLLNAAYPNVPAEAAVTLSGADAKLKADEQILSAADDKLLVTYAAGEITAKIKNPNDLPAAKTYKYTWTPALEDGTELKPVTVSVKVVNTATVTPTISASGKLDAVRRNDTAITYTVTKMSNVAARVEDVILSGTDQNLFELEYVDEPAKGLAQAVLTLKEGADVSTKASYRIRLAVKLEGVDAPVLSKDITVKVTQSKLTLSVVPKSATMFQGQDVRRPAEFTLTLTAPAGAKIESVALSQKTPLAFWKSLGSNAVVNWMPQADGTVLAQISVKDPSKVVNGKSYKVVLDVTAEGNATNVKPTAVTVTVKVMK